MSTSGNRRTHRVAAQLLLFTYGIETAAFAQSRPLPVSPVAAREAPRALFKVPNPSPAPRARDRQPAARPTMAVAAVGPLTGTSHGRGGGDGAGNDPCASDLIGHRAPHLSVAESLLWPPNHALVDVGANTTLTPPCDSWVT